MKFTKTTDGLRCSVKVEKTLVGSIIITINHTLYWTADWNISLPKDGEWDFGLSTWRRAVVIHFKANKNENNFNIVGFESTNHYKTIILANGEGVDFSGHLRS